MTRELSNALALLRRLRDDSAKRSEEARLYEARLTSKGRAAAFSKAVKELERVVRYGDR